MEGVVDQSPRTLYKRQQCIPWAGPDFVVRSVLFGNCIHVFKMATVAKFSIKSFALKWYFFNCPSSVILYAEYFSLFMKQLGFDAASIGLTSLFGVPQLFIPLYLLVGEKLRARKIAAFFGTLGLTVCCMLPLLAVIVPALQPTCSTTTSTDSVQAKQQALHTDGPVHSRYAKISNNSSASKIILFDLRSKRTPLLTNLPQDPVPRFFKTVLHPSPSQSQNTMPYLTSVRQLKKDNNSSVYSYSKDIRHQTASKFHEFLVNLSLENFVPMRQPRVRDDSIQSMYSSDTKRPSASKTQYLPYSTTNSFPNIKHSMQTNSSSSTNYSNNLPFTFKIHHPHPLVSALFLILTLSRSLTMYFDRADLSLANLATITYLKEEKASYGAYYLWTNIGCTFSISFVAVLAWFIKIDICGVEMPGYFIAFLCGGIMSLMSMLSLPWFKFEYDDKKSFNWSGVKSHVFNAHYIFMFIVLFYTGLCLTFQVYWEFWYLDKLSASPLLLGGAVLIRRPLVALSTFGASYLMKTIGDLNTICFTLFLYSSSFLALSFTRIAWLVLVVDTFQAAANGIGYCAFTVLFYKASSKENSSMILG